MIIQRRIKPAAILLAAAACTSGTDRAAATDSVAARPSAASDTRPSTPSTPPAMAPANDSAVTEHGLGPLRAGMTFADAKQALGGALIAPADTAGCHYATWRGGPRGVRVMIDDGRVARVDVDSAGVATAAGARVGDSEERIQRLYAGRVKTTPHKYEEGGHYLTVNAADDSSFAFVFETSKGRVTRYRAGRRPAVEYVEGCG
jgi:hypothetical protein